MDCQIDLNIQKKILIDILKYIDRICRKNNIKYTLYYGSLIGAVRHHGIIPWDDDVDIALLKDDYEKLIKCLENDNNQRFKLINVETEITYYYPFAKVVDNRTSLQEKEHLEVNNYGVYIDIFKLNNFPNEYDEQKKYYDGMIFLKKRIAYSIYNNKNKIFKWLYCKLRALSNFKVINQKYINYTERYNNKTTNYVFSNWPGYGLNKEKQLTTNFTEYIDIEFEDMKAMVVKNYDEILTLMYGDYMTPPPKQEQVSPHHTEVYWRDINEK